MPAFNPELERGLSQRRKLLGDAWVDQSLANANAFTADFQNFITRFAWNEIWSRPGLDSETRRIVVLVTTAALGRWEEYELHLRAALQGHAAATEGALSPGQIKEVLLQIAVYAGVPTANTGMRLALAILRELGLEPGYASVFDADQAGVGRSALTDTTPALHYTVREASCGNPRQTLVLSHALGADASMWDELAAAFSKHYRVVCYDHRGHGRSEAPAGPYTMEGLAADALHLIDALQARYACGAVVWIGLSLGGMVGQEVALRDPSKVRALVIANSTSGYGQQAREQWRQRIGVIETSGLEAIAEATMLRWFSPGFHAAHPARVARWRRRLVSTLLPGYLGACHAVMNMDTTGRLPRIRQPALVVAGAQDEGTPLAMSEQLVAGLPNARLVVIDQVAHMSALENVAQFARHVAEFLDSVT
jgi:3-oxoadipate enol-lactonase